VLIDSCGKTLVFHIKVLLSNLPSSYFTKSSLCFVLPIKTRLPSLLLFYSVFSESSVSAD